MPEKQYKQLESRKQNIATEKKNTGEQSSVCYATECTFDLSLIKNFLTDQATVIAEFMGTAYAVRVNEYFAQITNFVKKKKIEK